MAQVETTTPPPPPPWPGPDPPSHLFIWWHQWYGGSSWPCRCPQVQRALIGHCILMLMLMGNTRAGWCLTADNRLGKRRGNVGVNDNHQGEVKLESVCVEGKWGGKKVRKNVWGVAGLSLVDFTAGRRYGNIRSHLHLNSHSLANAPLQNHHVNTSVP